MLNVTSRAIVLTLLVTGFCALPLHGETAAAPAQTKTPARPPARPAPRTPAAPAPAPKPAEPVPPPKPVAQDLRIRTVYTTGPQKTESVTYFKGARERYEFADMILLKQYDLKRTVQISRAANTYLLVPDGAAVAPPAPAAPAPNQKPGIVTVTTTVTDTGERKPMFGLQARRVKTMIDRAATPGACDPSKQHIETDGWYIDLPAVTRPTPEGPAPQPAGACVDELRATQNGDAQALGFPIGYTTTVMGDDGKPNVVGMEITELEITNLDAALFDIPAGLSEAGNLGALSKAVDDANEVRLAQQLAAPAVEVAKRPGIPRVGVLEVTNNTAQQVDTRGLRNRLVTELVGRKIDAAPLAGARPDVIQQAVAHGYDYVLVIDVMDLKVSKGGGLGGALKAASMLAGGGGSSQTPTEATLSVKLVQPDGKSRLATNVKGKDGNGLDLKTGLGVAKFAGSMYMNVMTGRLMMSSFNQSMTGNLGGMGMLGNPALADMQLRGLTAGPSRGMRMGIDPTAGAASFLMQQAMAIETSSGGGAGQGPTFDASIAEALQQAAKAVSENLMKPESKKK